MLFLTIDHSRDTYIYHQIYEGIKAAIFQEKLAAHEKLPSKRKLADQLKVSVNSVANAYEQLLAEGYIYTKERSGYFVEVITPFINLQPSDRKKLSLELKEVELDKEGWLSLSHMTADSSMFPFKEWLRCEQKAVKHHKRELTEIPHRQGPYLVRQTISRMIAITRGVVCEPEQIVIGAGTQSLVQQMMGGQKEETIIAMENPGYSRFFNLLKGMGFNVQLVQLDAQGIDIKEVESVDADFLFVTPSHQFPTGKIMPISRRIELLNWASQSNGRYIVEDDYDSEFKYETDNIPSLQSLDLNQRVIYTGTFSKSLLPGFRISYMVLPIEILRNYRETAHDFMQSSNLLALYTLHYFIESGEYAKHIKRMNHYYESKRKQLIEILKKRFNNRIRIADIPAGLHFLADFKTDKNYEEIERRATEEKLEIYTMRRFMLNNKFKEKKCVSMVLGFANIHEGQMEEAVERLHKIIES
ncbi:PLP-dependent aminotransferase family protein [Pullulanibacillus sp. KACC 23026]|uniref:MocR-like transcriptional regulator GabR n=1 Tax=Pullulanibacillus sp. KACC 23026 TaxID=3028315 RepID=UPI0023AFE958|nr:PLP-dependent aminotransferase family protein [Pullulanibacillus sp. KACC 23026]WEG11124.1 PLP-dependent aminotransferase family protein [Pullulanibacillus sp. KACC 23026]